MKTLKTYVIRSVRGELSLPHTFRVESLNAIPTIVCLCGSTRFKDAFDEANYQETMKGNIVLSVGFFMHASNNRHGESVGATPEQKIELDVLHKRKIDLADEIFVLNVDGYVGSSTASEICYAYATGKPVRWLNRRLDHKSFERVATLFHNDQDCFQQLAASLEEVV